ncbi:MAG: hypothetical protein COB62_04940 [Piscirickettsiaceae bacterium]|nr:MAG: hypothetical protein COB62_04940 [Piscirickettsiaceae bacterium]
MTKNNCLQLIRVSLLALIFFFPHANAEENPNQILTHQWKTPTTVFDNAGTLWVTYAEKQSVYTRHSTDSGKTFFPAVLVNQTPQNIYTNGENRPKIAIGDNGNVYVSWTEKTKGRFNGDIHFARSTNGGHSFESDRIINDDKLSIGHRFDSLYLTPSGNLYIVWLDKRLSVKAKELQHNYPGISLYYSVSADQGASFSANKKIADHTCECCRIAISGSGLDGVAIMWRQLFKNGIRDHAITRLAPNKKLLIYRATFDGWKTDACPHHGPSISPANQHSYHMTWFSNGSSQKGIYYAKYNLNTGIADKGVLIDSSPSASHPYIKQVGDIVWLVWKKFEDNKTHIKEQHSTNGGHTWSLPRSVAQSQTESDHPIILNKGKKVYLSWHTKQEGLRLAPLSL